MSNILFKKNTVHYYPKMKFFMILLFVTFAYYAGSVQEHANSRCNMDFLRMAHDQAEKCVCVNPVILYICAIGRKASICLHGLHEPPLLNIYHIYKVEAFLP